MTLHTTSPDMKTNSRNDANSSTVPPETDTEAILASFKKQIQEIKAIDYSTNERVSRLIELIRNFRLFNWESYKCEVLYVILQELASLCFELRISDSGTVCDILRIAETISNPLQIASSAFGKTLQAIDDKHEDMPTENLDNCPSSSCCIRYFLEHATANRLKISGKIFAAFLMDLEDYPDCHYDLMLSCDPECLLEILQHGSSFLDDCANKSGYHRAFAECVAFLIAFGWEQEQWKYPTLELQASQLNLYKETLGLQEKLRFMLRAVRSPHVLTLKLSDMLLDLPDVEENSRLLSAMLTLYDTLFPGRFFGRSRAPSLMNLCRYTIRKQLEENWQLPHGIQKLILPQSLKRFINLEED